MKKLLIKFWPFLFIFLIWFIFAVPYFIQNKVPFPSTYLVNFFSPWNAYPGFSSPVKNNAMPDIITQILPWKNLVIDALKAGQIPLWNPYSFSGMPLLANYQSAPLSPLNLLFIFLPFVDGWRILILLQPLLAGCFMLLYLRSLKLSDFAAVLGSVSFMFCGFITTWMAYGTLGYAILFLPLALYLIEKFYEDKNSRFLILYAFVFPLSFFSGHFQISIYFFIFTCFYLLLKYFQTKNIKITVFLILYTVFGILLCLFQLLPSIELYTQTLRSEIFLKTEVIPWGYLATFLSPDIFGNPVTRNDWFGHYAEWNSYIGLIPLILAAYAIFIYKNKTVLFFILTAGLAILLSFQTPVLDILVNLQIPVLSTSAASRIIVIFSFSACVLSAYGLEKLWEDLKNKNLKKVFFLVGFFVVIFSLLWVLIISKNIIPLDKIVIAKQNMLLPSVLFLIFVFLVFLLILFNNKLKNIHLFQIVFFIILLLVSFDLIRFVDKWMPFDQNKLMYPKLKIDDEFAMLSGFDRVYGNLGGEATTYYKLSSIEGYDAVYIKRYGEFIASLNTGGLEESQRSVVSFPKYGLYSKKALDLLGVKYIIYKIGDGHQSWVYPFWNAKTGIYTLIYEDGIYQILQNNDVLPRTFLANSYTVETNPQLILNTMFSDNFDFKNSLVLEKNPKIELDQVKGTAKIISYKANEVKIEVSSSGNALLFLSDTYYPGWKAFVDNKETEIFRADFTFRAINVPKGNHVVEFIYNPQSFNFGLAGGFLGIIAIFGFGVILKKKKFI
jgi:uncharacterized membrane protein YfhO